MSTKTHLNGLTDMFSIYSAKNSKKKTCNNVHYLTHDSDELDDIRNEKNTISKLLPDSNRIYLAENLCNVSFG